jgi:hypothetical protein
MSGRALPWRTSPYLNWISVTDRPFHPTYRIRPTPLCMMLRVQLVLFTKQLDKKTMAKVTSQLLPRLLRELAAMSSCSVKSTRWTRSVPACPLPPP